MGNFSHCQQCGRKLRDAIFCPRCSASLCSRRCFVAHLEQHTKLVAIQPVHAMGTCGKIKPRSA